MYSSRLTSIGITILCVWILIFADNSLYAETQHFQFTANTGNNATIILPLTLEPSVDGERLEPGDEIGIFTGDGLCVGAVVWKNEAQSITVWGNNDQTAEKDGMEVGDSIYYRVWRQSTDIEYKNIQVEYDADSPFADTSGQYAINAIYILTSLSTFPEPAAPILLSPHNNQRGLPVSATLSWEKMNNADEYQLQVSTEEDLDTTFIDVDAITDTTYELTDLEPDRDYFWRVRALNLAGAGEWSPTWKFTTYPAVINIDHSINFGDPSSVTSYRMVGLPGDIDLPMSSVMSGTAGTDWTAFYDDGSIEDYLIEYNGSNRFNFRPGRGFWILSRNGFNYQGNQSSVELNPESIYEIPLHSGWNIISSPFEVPVSWETVQAHNDIITPIWNYNGSFSQNNTMAPYQGYYFNNNDNLTSLAIPYPDGGNLSKPAPIKPELAHSLHLFIRSDDVVRSDIAIGITQENYDRVERYTVHAPPSDFEEASIRMQSGRVHTRIMNPSHEGYTFDIQINLPANKSYSIDIHGTDTFDGYDILLVNRRSGTTIELHRQNSIDISSSSGTELYKLIIGNEEFTREVRDKLIPTEITLAQNYPNPFNPDTNIDYSIPAEKENVFVSLEIFNVLGQTVRTLIQDHHTAGFYSVAWDARDDRGLTVPSGLYIYRLQAGSTVLSKRMLFLK